MESELKPAVNELVSEILESASRIVSQIDNRLKGASMQDEIESSAYAQFLKYKNSGGRISPCLRICDLSRTPSGELLTAKNFVEDYEEYHKSCFEALDSETPSGVTLTEITEDDEEYFDSLKPKKKKEKSVKHGGVTHCIPIETDSNVDDDSDYPASELQLVPYDARYNLPKALFSRINTDAMVEITDQNIDVLHQNVEISENNPDMITDVIVFEPSKAKDYVVEDDDDVYKPIAVSPCGRFFKYEEEVCFFIFFDK